MGTVDGRQLSAPCGLLGVNGAAAMPVMRCKPDSQGSAMARALAAQPDMKRT